jgi:signal transduction histidine kinase/CheY-like chemotaxis protein/HPt (histidine-containing phosphotransfer) domain-containing protein
VTDDFAVREELVERQKRERAARLATVEIPILRFIGSLFLSVGVFITNRYIVGGASLAGWTAVTAILVVYCAVSSALLAAFYRRAPFDLSLLFLVVDLPVWTLAIYYSGAEQSWLFFILFMRVADQTQTTFRRCLAFVTLGTLSYAGMLAWVLLVDGRPIAAPAAAAKLVFIFFGGFYIALSARTAETRRASLARAIRMSRDLIRQMESQSGELREARQHAEEASAAKSEFLANMSHEMRTPLHGILGMLQLAISDETSPPRSRQLEMARRSAETLLATIGDILDFSKIEARKLDLEPLYFSIRELLADTAKALGVTAAEKGLVLSLDVDPAVPDRLWGDPLRLRQIVVNLVGNAVKFTNEGEIVLRASADRVDAAGAALRFEVRDTGIGIDPAKRDSIFDPFAQVDGSHSRRYGGTGLGLSIVAHLVRAMGGTVAFDSEPGRGSVFRFTLSLPCDPAGSAPPPEWERGLEGMRVVVIEPSAGARNVAAAMLRAHGAVPEPYSSAREAMQPPIRAAYSCVVGDAASIGAWSPAVPAVRIRSPLSPAREGEIAVTRPFGERELLDAVGLALGLTDRTLSYTLERSARPRQSLRVLVVDDHPVNLEFAAEALRRLGHAVTPADTGEEAIELMLARSFDAVLMDVQMPGLDGREVTRRFRTARGDRTPVIGLTAATTSEDREQCLAAGMNGVLTKPVTLGGLANALRGIEPSPEARHDAILGVVGGNRRLLARVRDAFAAQTPRLLNTVREAIDGQDGEALYRAAHTMKGALSNFDVPTASETAVQLEEAARERDFEVAAVLLPRLEHELRVLEERIDAALG